MDNNAFNCEILQQQFEVKLNQATQDKIRNGGYTKEGLQVLVEAAMCQKKLSELTTGLASAEHRKEYLRLLQLVHGEMEHQGLIEKRPTPPPQTQTQPTAPVNPDTTKPAANPASAPMSDELPADFSVEKFIFEPKGITLDDVKSNSKLVDLIRATIYSIDIRELYPNATKGWKDEEQQPNFLFYGPPGTGKSHLCSAIAGTLKQFYPGKRSAMFLMHKNNVPSKYVGVTGKILQAIFEAAERYEFAVICIDEIESICPSRELSENKANYTANFLELMEGVHGRTKAMVIACTNYPWKMDTALLGRLNKRVFIDYPTKEDIVAFWKSSKQKRDYFGETPEEQNRLIDIAAELCAQRHFSYRNIHDVNTALRDRVIAKTQEAYPNGSNELEHMLPVGEEELPGIISQTKSDYIAEEYQKYKAYDKVGVSQS